MPLGNRLKRLCECRLFDVQITLWVFFELQEQRRQLLQLLDPALGIALVERQPGQACD